METAFTSTRSLILNEIFSFLKTQPHTTIAITNFLSQLLKTHFSSKLEIFLEFFQTLIEENKQINFIRHGQSTYNEWRSKHLYNLPIFYENKASNYDPRLTETGKMQAERARKDLKEKIIDIVIVSPLTRALETFQGLQLDDKNVLACDLIREGMDFSCDVGSVKKKLEQEFKIVDFMLITNENWWRNNEDDILKDGKEVVKKESKEKLFIRILLFVIWVLLTEEKNILIVSHQNIYQCLFNNYKNFKGKINNCEIKTWSKKQMRDFLVAASCILAKKIKL